MMDKPKVSSGIQKTNMKGRRKAQNIKILPKSSTLQVIRQDPTEHYGSAKNG